MTIKSITLRNFMNISQASLEFQRGINVLAGDFGQGKSAILEAIAFCLLKDHKRGDTWEDYLKRDTEDGEIDLVVQMSADEADLMVFHYDMVRGHEVTKTVTYRGVSYNTNSAVNEFLAKTIDQEMLKNITFLMQNGQSINDMTPATRRDIFKKIFNSEFPLVLSKIESDTEDWKSKENDKKIQIEALKAKQYPFQRLVEVDPSELEALKIELKGAQHYVTEKAKYDAYLAQKNQLEGLQKRLSADKLTKSSHDLELASLAKKKSDFVGCIELYTQQAQALDASLKTTQEEVTTARGLLARFVQGEKEEKTNSPIPGLNEKIALERKGVATETAKKQVIAIHKATHERGECTQCGQKTDASKIPEMVHELEACEVAIKVHNEKIQEYEKSIQDYRDKLTSMTTTITEATKKVNDLVLMETQKKSNLIAKQKEITDTHAWVSELTTITIPKQEKLILELSTRIGEEETEVQTLQGKVEESKMDEPVLNGRQSSVIQQELDDLISLVAGNAEKTKINEQLKLDQATDKVTLETYNADLNTITLKLKRLKAIKKNWEVEFPNFINLAGCDILQTQMNGFFEKNRGGFTVSLKQTKKGIDFAYKVGDKDKFGTSKMASGFESAILTLSFKVAVAKASGSPLIFLDEPDASADGQASIRVFDTIQNIGQFEQQFVISHKKEAVQFLKEGGALVYYVKEGVFSNYE